MRRSCSNKAGCIDCLAGFHNCRNASNVAGPPENSAYDTQLVSRDESVGQTVSNPEEGIHEAELVDRARGEVRVQAEELPKVRHANSGVGSGERHNTKVAMRNGKCSMVFACEDSIRWIWES